MFDENGQETGAVEVAVPQAEYATPTAEPSPDWVVAREMQRQAMERARFAQPVPTDTQTVGGDYLNFNQGLAGQAIGRGIGRCNLSTHYWECRHELSCDCGQMVRRARAGEVVSEGL